jgi:hypothetical protein
MKIKRGKGKRVILVLSALTCGCLQFLGSEVLAQTCMTQDLFLYIEPKKPASKAGSQAAEARKKTARAGIAVMEPKTSSSRSKQGDERRFDHRQKIAGRN